MIKSIWQRIICGIRGHRWVVTFRKKVKAGCDIHMGEDSGSLTIHNSYMIVSLKCERCGKLEEKEE